MQDVSVLPFWRCLERRGGPDFYVTEYFRVHRDSHPDRTILRSISEMSAKKPVIAQMIGNNPDDLVRTARLIQDATDTAGMDLNLGCPAPKVCGKQAGGALLRDRDLIRRIVGELRSVVRGTLTLKTRIGFASTGEFDDLLALFASLPIDGLAVHGRTVKEKYQTPVHPDCIARAVERMPCPVIANGNIVSVATALGMHRQTKAAGLMIGRGGIRNPWLFAQIRASFEGTRSPVPTLRDLATYLRELASEIAEEGTFESETPLVHRLKKFTNYISSGISGGTFTAELRRATTLAGLHLLCETHLDSDAPLPPSPDEDGKLFCGFHELSATD